VNIYAAPGGLSRQDVAWAVAAIAAATPIGAAALTALDPAADHEGRPVETALALGVAIINAVEWSS